MLLKSLELALGLVGIQRTGSAAVLVACSGGRDSMALLRVSMKLLGPQRVYCGHVQHNTRLGGRFEAEALQSFCQLQSITFVREELHPASADEATLRRLRYEALYRMMSYTEASIILMAHTQDDQAETVLLGLLRGGRLANLAGMPMHNGCVLRPWLYVQRKTVHRYLAHKRWPHWEDPSNREPIYLRNRIRKELMPLLERRYARALPDRLAKLARECAFAVDTKSRTELREGRLWFEQGISVSRVMRRFDHCQQGPRTTVADVQSLRCPRVRLCQKDDRVRPMGTSGKMQSVWELLAALGIEESQRGRFPVVVDDDDHIVWVPGCARSEKGWVTDTTKEVWVFSVDDNC
ncbi:MAG: tRNA lysidine(34) synthetase TilS [Myxococcales bacterium]|nr:tRNA lysidine(34) synthetase TilS [Myxococcales bacterium]